MVGPLALLPFVTLVVLALRHPEAMGWLGHGWRKSETPRLLLYSFDALVLFILAVGSAFGARTLFMLAGRLPRPDNSASIIFAARSAAAVWARFTSPNTSF